ncbi:hypothetical protein [Salinimicrobium xinjiangense]|uniref:hypothetical protein n=1 Tax=Salinimicrobium xinjiangense TaxID=438596 RepID=UPI0012EB5D82|nr:hypothetical protein [Salinimicrobium xinjiangense]
MSFNIDENTSGSFDVTVYTATTTGSDRTFTINVDESTTINADSYSLPQTVTVPANTNEVTFTVEVTDNSIGNFGEVLVLELAEEQGLSAGAPLTVDITKICEFEPVGTFINDSGWFEAEYPVTVEAGASANQYVVKDMFAEGTDVTFTVNADYTVSVPKQNAWVSGTYGQASVTGQTGSKFNPCSREVTLILQHTVAAGSFGTYTELLTFSADTDGGDTDGGDTDGGDTDGGDTDGGDTDGGDSDA